MCALTKTRASKKYTEHNNPFGKGIGFALWNDIDKILKIEEQDYCL